MDAPPPQPPEYHDLPAVSAETERLASLIDAEATETFDRRLVDLACGPGGPGFAHARLLRWDERIEAFQVAAQFGAPVALRVLMHVVAPESIGMAAERAWKTDEPSHGVEVTATGVSVLFGAIPLARGRGVLVGRWAEHPGDPDARLGAWWRWLRLAADARDRRLAARRAERRVEAVRELAAMVVSPHHVSEVIHAAARLAAAGTEADGAAVWLPSAENGARLEVTYGSGGMRDRAARGLRSAAERVIRGGAAYRGAPQPDEGLATADVRDVWVSALGAAIPAAGALAVWREDRNAEVDPAPLSEAEAFLAAIADTLAAALDRALDVASRREAEQRAQAAEHESARLARQAGYGPLATRARGDAYNAAAAVRTFAARVRDSLPEPELARDYADALSREAERLERALGTQDACAADDGGDRILVGINDLVNDALRAAGERLVRRRVRLLKRLAPDLPPLVLDARRVGQAIAQLVAMALDSIAVGGRVRIETRRLPNHVVLHVGHDGAHVPGEALEQLFVPFVSGPPGGAPVGLGVADRIVHEHGGELRVRAEGEWNTMVDLALPIRDLKDRRQPGGSRRTRSDRRQGAWSDRGRAAG